MDRAALDEVAPFGRVVLLAIVEAATEGTAPVRSYEVRERCESHLGTLDAFDSGIDRDRVIAALSDLEERGLLRSERVESPVGKGRPGYALANDPDAVLDVLAGDEHVGPAAERLRER